VLRELGCPDTEILRWLDNGVVAVPEPLLERSAAE